MTNHYMQQFRSSLEQRQDIKTAETSGLIIAFTIFLVAYIILAMLIAPENRLEYHFVKESGIITALSSVLLAFASGFAGLAFFLSKQRSGYYHFFWLLCFLGFLYFSLDELLQFHELTGRLMRHELGRVEFFRNWNDIIVIAYGVVAIPVIIFFIPEVFRFPRVAELMAAAFSFYIIHTIIDSTSKPSTTLSGITEESAKLFSSGFFALTMFVAVLGIIYRSCNDTTNEASTN